jgi:hypothetical protein
MNAMAANLLLDFERVKREIDRNVKQHSDQPYGICSTESLNELNHRIDSK